MEQNVLTYIARRCIIKGNSTVKASLLAKLNSMHLLSVYVQFIMLQDVIRKRFFINSSITLNKFKAPRLSIDSTMTNKKLTVTYSEL